jgi:hypothetical protein
MRTQDPLIKQLIGVIIFYLMVSPLVIYGDWTTYSINQSEDDLFITQSGSVFQTSNWISVSEPATGIRDFLAFRNIYIPNNSTLDSAILSFRSPTGILVNETLLVTIYGIKEGTLDNWSDTSNLLNLPFTTSSVNWNTSSLQDGKWVNVSVIDIVQEIRAQYLWNSGNDIGFRIQSIAQSNRWFYSYDGHPNLSARLYINTTTISGAESYRGYTIIPNTENGSYPAKASGVYYNGSEYRFIQFHQNGTISHNASTAQFNDPQRNQPIMISGEIYLLNSTGAILKTPDFITYTYLDTIAGVGVMSEPYGMAWDEDNNVIHIAYHISNDMKYTNYSITNNTVFGASDHLYTGGANIPVLTTSIDYLENNGSLAVLRVGETSVSTNRDAIWKQKKKGQFWSASETIDLSLIAGQNGFWGKVRFHENQNTTLLISVTNNAQPQRRVYAYSYNMWLEATGDIPDIGLGRWKPITGAGDKFPNQYGIIYPDGRVHVNFVVDVDGVEYMPRTTLSYRPWTVRTTYDGINASGGTQNFRFTFPFSTIYWNDEYEITDSNTLDAMKERNFWVINYQTATGKNIGFYYFEDLQAFDIGYSVDALNSLFVEPTIPNAGSGGFNMIDITHGTYVPSGFTVIDENNTSVNTTCIQQATTIEEVKACIDDIIGTQDPQDPNPPETDYPQNGFGVLTRFNLRFWIHLIGWILIWSPLFAMAVRTYPIQYYFVFVIVMIFGLGLVWSIGSI